LHVSTDTVNKTDEVGLVHCCFTGKIAAMTLGYFDAQQMCAFMTNPTTAINASVKSSYSLWTKE